MGVFTAWQLRRRATLGALLAVAWVVTGCAEGDLEPAADDTTQAPDLAVPPGYELRQLAAPAVRFSMPKQLTLKVESFDPTLPPQKFRHELSLIDDQNIQVLVHVWDNPQHLGAHEWFQVNMAGFVTQHSSLRQTRVTRHHFPAVVLEEPASPEAVSQEFTVFATADHVYSITCIDPATNRPAKKLFDHVVDSFEPEVVAPSEVMAPSEVQP